MKSITTPPLLCGKISRDSGPSIKSPCPKQGKQVDENDDWRSDSPSLLPFPPTLLFMIYHMLAWNKITTPPLLATRYLCGMVVSYDRVLVSRVPAMGEASRSTKMRTEKGTGPVALLPCPPTLLLFLRLRLLFTWNPSRHHRHVGYWAREQVDENENRKEKPLLPCPPTRLLFLWLLIPGSY